MSLRTVGDAVLDTSRAGKASGFPPWLFGAALWAAAAQAQVSAAAPDMDQTDERDPYAAVLDRITVVGTRLQRIDLEGPLPITSIEHAELEVSGRTTVSDVLRDLPYNSHGTVGDQPSAGIPGSRVLALRGLPPAYTLVLLDGQRLPGYSGVGGGAATNVAGLPLAAIERVEVLRDGASAIYGSEAIGGVVNLVTRRGAQRPTFGVQWDHPSEGGGRMRAADAVWGVKHDDGDWLLALQVATRDPLLATQRPYLLEDAPLSQFGAPGSFRRFHPVTGAPVGLAEPDPRCPQRPGEDPVFPSSGRMLTPAGELCGYRFRDDNHEHTGLDSASAFASLRQRLGETLWFDGRLMLWRNQTQAQLAASPGPFLMAPDNPFNPTRGEFGPDLGYLVQVPYRLTPLGPRRTEAENDNLHLALRLNGQHERFAWWLGAQHNRHRLDSEGVAGYALASAFQGLVASGRFDPFSAVPGEPGVLAETAHRPWTEGRSRNDGIEAGLNLDMFELPHGSVELAIGASVRRDAYRLSFDEESRHGDVIGAGVSGAQADAGRNHAAGFVEALLPLTGTAEANLALRYDHYQDSGRALSPKLALSWRARDSLLLRAAHGRGFRVVDLESGYAATTVGSGEIIDHVRCAQAPDDPVACGPLPVELAFPANPAVDPEHSRQTTLGLVWRPWAGGSLGLDVYQLRLEDRIRFMSPDEVMRNELDCLAADRPCDSLRQGQVIRDGFGNAQRVIVPLVNSTGMRLRGLDIDLSQRIETARGDFTLSLRGSRLLRFERQSRPDMPAVDALDYAAAPRQRATAAIDYTFGRYALNATTRFIDGYRACDADLVVFPNGQPNPACDLRIGSHIQIDLRASAELGRHGRLALGVRNLANREAPLNRYALLTDDLAYGLYDVVGRVPYLRYEQRF